MDDYDSETMFDNPFKIWPDADLEKAYNQIEQILNYRAVEKQAKDTSELNVNGITAKDFAVIYAPLHEQDGNPVFSFYIVHDGKLYDLTEDAGVWDEKHNFKFHSWWPIVNDEDETDGYGFTSQNIDGKKLYNAAFKFIPSGFLEECENCYDYGKGVKKAIEVLKKHGFETIIEATYEDQGSFDDVYKEWLKKNKTV